MVSELVRRSSSRTDASRGSTKIMRVVAVSIWHTMLNGKMGTTVYHELTETHANGGTCDSHDMPLPCGPRRKIA
jgi:hypothetical protein